MCLFLLLLEMGNEGGYGFRVCSGVRCRKAHEGTPRLKKVLNWSVEIGFLVLSRLREALGLVDLGRRPLTGGSGDRFSHRPLMKRPFFMAPHLRRSCAVPFVHNLELETVVAWHRTRSDPPFQMPCRR
jgi:hypothetical protein